MKTKIKIEPEVKTIFHDDTTQYLIQQTLQDIYSYLDKLKEQPAIIYMSQEELVALEEPKRNSKFQEESIYEDL